MANVGMVGLDWQTRIDWDRLRKYRLERARERMKAHGLGAMLLMYDENVRYVTSTLTPGWNRLKPGLRYALLCGAGAPVLFAQGGIGYHARRPRSPPGDHPLVPRVDHGRGRPRLEAAGQEVHRRHRQGDEALRGPGPDARRGLHRHQHARPIPGGPAPVG